MNHLTLRGTHREMGFQWGARLAERGLRLLDHGPSLEAGGGPCRLPAPAYEQHFPPPWRLEGLAAGRTAGGEDLETVLFYLPAARLRLFLPGGVQRDGCSSDGTATFGAGAGLHPCDMVPTGRSFTGTRLVRADENAVNAGTGHPGLTSTRPGPAV